MYRLFCPRIFFKICVLSQCMVCWIHIKKHYFIHFCLLVLKLSEVFNVSLKKGFLKTLQNSQENTSIRVSFLKKLQAFNIFRDNNQLKYTQKAFGDLNNKQKIVWSTNFQPQDLKNASNILNDTLTIFDDFKKKQKAYGVIFLVRKSIYIWKVCSRQYPLR